MWSKKNRSAKTRFRGADKGQSLGCRRPARVPFHVWFFLGWSRNRFAAELLGDAVDDVHQWLLDVRGRRLGDRFAQRAHEGADRQALQLFDLGSERLQPGADAFLRFRRLFRLAALRTRMFLVAVMAIAETPERASPRRRSLRDAAFAFPGFAILASGRPEF